MEKRKEHKFHQSKMKHNQSRWCQFHLLGIIFLQNAIEYRQIYVIPKLPKKNTKAHHKDFFRRNVFEQSLHSKFLLLLCTFFICAFKLLSSKTFIEHCSHSNSFNLTCSAFVCLVFICFSKLCFWLNVLQHFSQQ